MGAILWGFLYARKKVKTCQENRGAGALGAAVQDSQRKAASIAGSTNDYTINSTTGMNALPMSTKNTDGHGNASVTAMLQNIRCVNCVLRKAGSLLLKRYTTFYQSHRAGRMTVRT